MHIERLGGVKPLSKGINSRASKVAHCVAFPHSARAHIRAKRVAFACDESNNGQSMHQQAPMFDAGPMRCHARDGQSTHVHTETMMWRNRFAHRSLLWTSFASIRVLASRGRALSGKSHRTSTTLTQSMSIVHILGWTFPRRHGSHMTTEICTNPAPLHVLTSIGAMLSAPGCL